MSTKSTESQFVCVWLTLVVLLTVGRTVTGCNVTIYTRSHETLDIDNDPQYCEIKLISPDDYKDTVIRLHFSQFYLNCPSEYIEIWNPQPQQLISRLCGYMKYKSILLEKLETNALIIKYKVKKSRGYGGRWMYYSRYNTPNPPTPDTHYHNHNTRKKSHKTKPNLGIVTVAVGIVLAVCVLIGALACGFWIANHAKPRRARRTRRHLTVTPTELPTETTDITKHPRLPNYYDNESAVPPPYLETISSDGNPVYPPSYYEMNPPPYSILDAEGSLETSGDTRATDRMNLSQ